MSNLIVNEQVLTPIEIQQIEYHSLLNILNVVSGHLQLLILDLNQHQHPILIEQLHSIIKIILNIPQEIKGGATSNQIIDQCHQIYEVTQIFINIHQSTLTKTINKEKYDFLKNNLDSIFKVLTTRLSEIDEAKCSSDWQEYTISTLIENYRLVFKAVEFNSRGRYKIYFNPNQNHNDKNDVKDNGNDEDKSYQVRLNINSQNKQTITLSKIITDVLRDLLLNARKYTNPGKGPQINCEINDDGLSLKITVSDNGLGIPINEINQCVRFGYRASNVQNIQSNGGGFGLTKAYYVCQMYGGKLYIDSILGQGTTVTILLPRGVATPPYKPPDREGGEIPNP